jgi:hypothetical protein
MPQLAKCRDVNKAAYHEAETNMLEAKTRPLMPRPRLMVCRLLF